jgi:hypothetical protein
MHGLSETFHVKHFGELFPYAKAGKYFSQKVI